MVGTIKDPKPAEQHQRLSKVDQLRYSLQVCVDSTAGAAHTDHIILHMPLPTYVCQVAGA